jgi:tetratricopeptide (TPR) repeat protein
VASCVVTVLLCFCLAEDVPGQMIPPRRLDDIEGHFFEQLLDRELFELAEEYCLDRLESRQDKESLAFWTDRLSTAYLQHTWLESGPNRTALTQTGVRKITEFLSDELVSPEAETALRLAQVDLLLNLIRIDSFLMRVGHRGPSEDRRYPQLKELNVRIAQATALIDGLSGQLNRFGRQIDRDQTSLLRDRARRISVELQAISVLMNREDSASVMKLLYRLKRSARTDSTRWRVLELQTELLLLAGDFERNDLTLRRMDDQFPDRHDEQTELRIRSLLRRGQPTEALSLSESVQPLRSAARRRSLDVLRLESLLQLRMLAGQLQDAALIQKTDSRFDSIAEQSHLWIPSVHQDAARSLIASCKLIRTVGSEVAGLIEDVELLQASGEQEHALRELHRALRLLPPDASLRSRGAICLAIGELHISKEMWSPAINSLQLAQEHFSQARLPEFASRSDLLHAFCLGQQWRKEPDDGQLHADYVDALIQHRIQWNDQVSWDTATDWLIQVTQQTDPLLACELLQEVAQRTAVNADQLDALTRWGMLLEAHWSQSPVSQISQRRRDLVDSFLKACGDVDREPDELASEKAGLRLLELVISTDAQTAWKQWTTIASELPGIRRQLQTPSAETQARFTELQLVATSRTSTDPDVQEQLRNVVCSQHSVQPLPAAIRLGRFLTNTGLILPGDSFLAATIEKLIQQQLELPTSPPELLTMFSLTCLTGRLTPNQNLKEQVLSLLLEQNLTAVQVKLLADTLLKSNVSTDSESANDLMQLWHRIRAESPEGSDMWLEACLQLAQIRSQKGQTQQAAQQLRVTSVLYPEWGAAERLGRVTQLLRHLESKSESD